MKGSRRMWIIVQLDQPQYVKKVHETVVQIIQAMGGQVTNSSSLGDLFVLATFAHRKCKTLEKAIAAGLIAIPVKRTIVAPQDPYVLRDRTAALTMELYRRQSEVLGLSTPPPPE